MYNIRNVAPWAESCRNSGNKFLSTISVNDIGDHNAKLFGSAARTIA